MYKILIKSGTDGYKFYTVGGEVKVYDTLTEIKDKYLELIKIYPKNDIDVIKDIKEIVDVTFEEEQEPQP